MKHLIGRVLCLGFTACAHVTAESSFHDKGLERASFELSCPKESLERR
jgi:hypothetical protein